MRTDVRSISDRIDSALLAAEWSTHVISVEIDTLDAPQLADLVPALASTISRFEAVRLSALRAADRARVGDLAGMPDTASWAAAMTGERRGKARGDVELAGKLAALGPIASALASGRVSKSQAAALAGADAPSDEEQADLLADAESLSLPELERRVERFNLDRNRQVEAVVPAVTVTPTRGGMRIEGTLDTLGGEAVTTALDAAVQLLSFENGTGRAERRALGLVAIARYFLDHHTEVTHRLGRPHIVANVPLAVLAGAAGSAVLASGAVIDAATARQLACDASVSRLITGPASEPLDVGRATRSIPTAIARQLIIDDQHCRHPGCAHHVVFWEGPSRGETKLTNLVLLCWQHHHLLHKDPGWRLVLDPTTRRLDVHYHHRHVGSTHPPGRQRTGPDPAPARPTSTTDATPDCSWSLVDDACAGVSSSSRPRAPRAR
jgi:hypothetical protein